MFAFSQLGMWHVLIECSLETEALLCVCGACVNVSRLRTSFSLLL
jgi:hypothetical protein